MIKILLLILLFSSSTYLGFQIAKVYQEKKSFYFDLLTFTKNIKNEISFLKTDIISMISKYDFKSSFGYMLKKYQQMITEKGEVNTEDFNNFFSQLQIEENDKNIIIQMFLELGNIGYYEQIERLNYYIENYKTMLDRSEEKASKMSAFYKKMGVLVGSLLCVVLI